MTNQTKRKIIAGIDVGSTKVKVLVGERANDGLIDIISFGAAPVFGVRKGTVVDLDEVITAVSGSLEEAERMCGVPIDRGYISISGATVSANNSHGTIAISRADGEITKDDVNRVIEAARAISLPANRDIIHVLPRYFIVDGQEGIKDPVGMNGVRLEVDAHVVSASTPAVKNLLKCAYQAGLDVEELVLASLADARSLLSKKQKEIGVVLIDIGGNTTDMIIYEEGEVLQTIVLPIGAGHITNDIAIGLRTSLEVAERIKIDYGTALPFLVPEREIIDFSEIDPSVEDVRVSRRYVAEIIEARVLEIFSMIRDELKKVGRDGLLPAGAVLTGGGSKLPGMVDIAKDNLRLPAQVGLPLEARGLLEKDRLDDPIMATALGLVLWGADSESGKDKFVANLMEGIKGVGGIFSKVRGIFK